MKTGLTVSLKAVIVLVGIGVFTFMLWEPHVEGRNAQATLFQIYFNDPFLAYAYTASIAFFVALHRAFKLVGYIEQDKKFSKDSVNALRTIKYCAVTLIGFIAGAEAYFFIVQRSKDDIAGGVVIGLVMIFISALIGGAAAKFEKILQNAVDIKFDNGQRPSRIM